jgi:16S rRNA (guanine527-N7)-methyltransferase
VSIVSRETTPPLTEAGFVERFPITDDHRDRLRAYVDLLGKWNRKINLVASSTLADVWRRHILDSAQILPLLPTGLRSLADLGSGAGLPGLILAILGAPNVHLVESDSRKAAFLREAARITGVAVEIHVARIERVSPISADVVTARALAPLSELLEYSSPLLKPGGSCYFLKGQNRAEEIVAARRHWCFVSTEIPSLSEASSVVLKLESIVRER